MGCSLGPYLALKRQGSAWPHPRPGVWLAEKANQGDCKGFAAGLRSLSNLDVDVITLIQSKKTKAITGTDEVVTLIHVIQDNIHSESILME